MTYADIIDQWRGYNGSCGLCGYWDERHRMIEAVRGRIKAGETVADLARDYSIDKRTIRAMMKCRIDHRRYAATAAARRARALRR